MLRRRLTRSILVALPSLLILPAIAAHPPVSTSRLAAAATRRLEVNNSGDLRDGWHSDRSIRLIYGTRYTIAGACDEDCTDLDLELYDRNGNLIRRDVDPDDTPIIVHTARYTGDYTLRVIMARCRIEPCHWETAVTP